MPHFRPLSAPLLYTCVQEISDAQSLVPPRRCHGPGGRERSDRWGAEEWGALRWGKDGGRKDETTAAPADYDQSLFVEDRIGRVYVSRSVTLFPSHCNTTRRRRCLL